MADLPSREELFARFRAAAIAVPNTRISAREIDRPGSDLNLLAACASILGEEIVGRAARALASCFEDTSNGDGLDRVVFDRKGLPRLPAAPSLIEFSLSRPTVAGGAGTIDGGLPGSSPTPTRVQTNRGVRYILTEPAVFGALDLGPIVVSGQAELAGLASEVDADQAWSFVDPPFDTTIVLANPAESAFGADEETDAAYRARAKDFFRTVRRGTLGAIEFGTRSTPGVDTVSVVELISGLSGLPVGYVQAFVLDALGQANQTLAVRSAITLLEYRAAGIPVQTIAAVPDYRTIRMVRPDFDSSIVIDTAGGLDRVATAVVAALDTQQPNQSLLRSTIISAVRSVPGVIFEDTDLLEPAGTLLPSSASTVFRTKRELIVFEEA